ncbi:ankyrin repeat domain-containing protein [Legionella jordanis]|nr:ankyrin repeat domain-containing protein [Legionella jordanis]
MKQIMDAHKIPAGIIELYQLIAFSHDFDMNSVKRIISSSNFSLFLNSQNQEQPFAEKEFSAYHEHCFETPLLAICHIASQHHHRISDGDLAEIIAHLLALHANPNVSDAEGNTPILLLASSDPERQHLTASIELLMKAGAEINATNFENKSALHLAFARMNFSLATRLYYDLGAKVMFDQNNNCFLHECEEHGIDELLEHIDELVRHLKLHHLISNFPEEKDEIYAFLLRDSSGQEVISVCQQQLMPITPRALCYCLDKIANEAVASALFNNLQKRLYGIYSWSAALSHFGFFPSISPDMDIGRDHDFRNQRL